MGPGNLSLDLGLKSKSVSIKLEIGKASVLASTDLRKHRSRLFQSMNDQGLKNGQSA